MYENLADAENFVLKNSIEKLQEGIETDFGNKIITYNLDTHSFSCIKTGLFSDTMIQSGFSNWSEAKRFINKPNRFSI